MFITHVSLIFSHLDSTKISIESIMVDSKIDGIELKNAEKDLNASFACLKGLKRVIRIYSILFQYWIWAYVTAGVDSTVKKYFLKEEWPSWVWMNTARFLLRVRNAKSQNLLIWCEPGWVKNLKVESIAKIVI